MSLESMTTYKQADGELVAGEYGWVTDLEFFEDSDSLDEPLEVVKEVWLRVSVESVWIKPPLYDCGLCDKDAVEWVQDDSGAWTAVCESHSILVASIPMDGQQ